MADSAGFFMDSGEACEEDAVHCTPVCILDTASGRLFSHFLIGDAVFGADSAALFASEVSREVTRAVNPSQ